MYKYKNYFYSALNPDSKFHTNKHSKNKPNIYRHYYYHLCISTSDKFLYIYTSRDLLPE